MKFRIRFAQQVVGAFVLLAMFLLVLVLILMGVNQRWFARNATYQSRFLSAEGITQGMGIKLRGFEIGKIKEINLTEDNRVTVTLEFYQEYLEKVRPDSVLELVSSPIGIGGGLVFLPGKNNRPALAPGSFIPSMDSLEGKSLVEAGLVDRLPGNEAVAGIINQVEPLLIEVKTTVIGVNELLGTLNKTLDGRMGTPAPGMVGQIQSLLTGLNSTIGTLNQTLAMASGHADLILANVGEVTTDVARVTEGLSDVKGLIPRLLDPKGSMATLLDDNNVLFNQIQGMIRQLGDTVKEINTFARFINRQSPQITGLLEETKQAVKQSQDVMEGLSNNPILRGGITGKRDQSDTVQGLREEDF